MPPATPSKTLRPCQGRRGRSGSTRRSSIKLLRAAPAALFELELDLAIGQRLERACRELLLEAGRNRILRESVQLARIACGNQNAEVFAARLVCYFDRCKDTHGLNGPFK